MATASVYSYPVAGIFFDELSGSVEDIEFYREVARRVKGEHSDWKLVGNAGQASVPEAYFEIFDTIVTFEGTPAMYRDEDPALHAGKSPQQKAHMIYNAYSSELLQEMLTLAEKHDLGYLYVTDEYHRPGGASPDEPAPPFTPERRQSVGRSAQPLGRRDRRTHKSVSFRVEPLLARG